MTLLPKRDRSILRAGICAGIALLPAALNLALPSGKVRSVAAASTAAGASHPDAVCRTCHQDIYDRYQQTPMARGSGPALAGLDPLQLAAENLVHAASGVTYRVFLRDGQPYLAYKRPAGAGRAALDGEHRLQLFVGSGHRGRTYLYQEGGLWFETPINWYAKTKQWDMAPAFEAARAMPDPLPVDPNCLHCHAGEVQPTIGAARNRYATEPFHSSGIGCAACHGDPSAHLAQTRTLAGSTTGATSTLAPVHHDNTASAIVNPSRLGPSARDSVCLQCHLEGDATVYLPGRSLQTYQPGENLSSSVIYFVDRSRAGMGFRATSQYEALLRSACKRSAGDRLTCTTCHDPHSSPAPAQRVAYFRARCLTCHTGEVMAAQHHPEQQDCAVCHMPTRNTSDISHEQLTDHDIEARPLPGPPSSPTRNQLRSADLVPVGSGVTGDRELGLAYAQLAQRGDRKAGAQALVLLQRAEQLGSNDTEVLDQLGFLLQISGSAQAAAAHYLKALQQNPTDITAAANLAVIEASSGEANEAVRLLARVVQEDPSQVSAGLNLAFLECRQGRKEDAATIVKLMIRYSPDSIAANRFQQDGVYGNQHCALK